MSDVKKKSRWGVGIAVVYGVFMVAIIALVIASRFQQVDLVSKDYYDKEVRYQEQIERLKATRDRGYELTAEYAVAAGIIRLKFPEGVDPAAISGTALLFRPSSSAMDKHFEIASGTALEQEISCGKLVRGLWKLRVDWQADSVQYYHEQEIYVE